MIKKLTHALTLASITAMTIGCGSGLAETDEQIIAATEEMLECIDGERERVTEAFIASSSLEAGTAVEMGTTRCLDEWKAALSVEAQERLAQSLPQSTGVAANAQRTLGQLTQPAAFEDTEEVRREMIDQAIAIYSQITRHAARNLPPRAAD